MAEIVKGVLKSYSIIVQTLQECRTFLNIQPPSFIPLISPINIETHVYYAILILKLLFASYGLIGFMPSIASVFTIFLLLLIFAINLPITQLSETEAAYEFIIALSIIIALLIVLCLKKRPILLGSLLLIVVPCFCFEKRLEFMLDVYVLACFGYYTAEAYSEQYIKLVAFCFLSAVMDSWKSRLCQTTLNYYDVILFYIVLLIGFFFLAPTKHAFRIIIIYNVLNFVFLYSFCQTSITKGIGWNAAASEALVMRIVECALRKDSRNGI